MERVVVLKCYNANKEKIRGFEVVDSKYRKYPGKNIILPIRSDIKSAGYDLRTPIEIEIKPGERKLVFTDIKAYMQQDEVLKVYVRSSIGIKRNVILSNITGIIDSSYYSNKDNDGNIGISLWNTGKDTVVFEENERICQCIFEKYLTVDNEPTNNNIRIGGFGSSGQY